MITGIHVAGPKLASIVDNCFPHLFQEVFDQGVLGAKSEVDSEGGCWIVQRGDWWVWIISGIAHHLRQLGNLAIGQKDTEDAMNDALFECQCTYYSVQC
jgi:hypothetical protein